MSMFARRRMALALCLAAATLGACRAPDAPSLRADTTARVLAPSSAGTLRAPVESVRIGSSVLRLPRPAPESLALPTLRGDTLRLADYRSRAVLVNFWTTWCAPCRRESDDLTALRDSGLVVIRVALDERGREVVRSYVEDREMPYPLALAGRRTANRFGGVYGLPTTFVIDREGRIVRRITGPVAGDSVRAFVRTRLRE